MKKSPPGPNLFDMIEQDIVREEIAAGKECTHPVEIETRTVWGIPCVSRLTFTCTICGKIRGRVK